MNALIPLVGAALLVTGCGWLNLPTEPSTTTTTGVGFFGQISGESPYVFELDDPTVNWKVNWLDEHYAGGGWIGGAETVAQTVTPVGGVWTFITT